MDTSELDTGRADAGGADGASAEVVLAALLEGLDADGRVVVAVMRPVVEAGRVVDFALLTASGSAARAGLATVTGPRPHGTARRLGEVTPPARFPDLLALHRAAFEAEQPVRRDEDHVDARGRTRALEVTRARVGGLLVVTWQDVTDLRRAEAARVAGEQRFRALVEHSSDITVVVDRERVVTYASPSTQRFTADGDGTLAGTPYGLPLHPADRELAQELLDRAYAAPPGQVLRERARVIAADGRTRWIEAEATNHLDTPGVGGVVINCRDITEEQHAREALAAEAVRDPLTGLPNRRYFTQALQHALARSARSGQPVALLLLDVDHFKHVNDAHGHPAGDRLLTTLAQRLRSSLRPSDTVCRLGGDEFVVLAEDLHHLDEALLLAERVNVAAGGTYLLDHGEVRVSVSIGVSTAVGPGDPDALLSTADHALYEAKRRGRDRAEVFQPQLREHLLHRLALQRDLRRATTRDELELYWQPILRASDHAVTGAEALLRWHHPEHGLLTPAAFIPAAEDAGLMPVICEWVLHHAAEQSARWARELADRPQVFVNLDRHQLHDPDLLSRVGAIADAHHADLTGLTLEVSERILTEDLPRIQPLLHLLRAGGLSLALDDFGAGNTALTWLQRMPMDVLKLDRSFTAALGDPASEAIVDAVLHLAPRLGIATLAEGVETAAQLATLVDLGCDYTQGFHHARPQPARELTAALLAP
ncbi:putative bifunctional diguanylate cyclase/phosphodiesterase [Kineococcus radiotolerans]|uniref:Diguanylate cyclase/phosphodiesterase with PAS/PAC and GAF sensor(S) n=1 Tax=Kineococcus radiotolerans (strain ATCC BAA-149 / DSM 14245 / SRS30216) TaxID=266940 RepID=A6WG31_KINRD|nr:EAL domain-containing protein [Kineococcus radiotolerans]ABS05770.1 diguanylate cyclase/phosphodiesterase with PAS/PAC and GAF sensor(s) [Kineococcus radiotolerans SRS30216 = ATCC BAA-149]